MVTLVKRTVVTFARWTTVSQPQLPPRFSEASHTAKTFFFLAASLLKVKELQPSPSKLVVGAEVDGSDL